MRRIQIVSAGPPLNNFLGIDDLTVCRALTIDSVEMTQAIQQIEPLSQLKTDLAATGEPPVPVIAGKPGTMRVYMSDVDDVTDVTVKLTIPGVITQSKDVEIVPGCTAAKQRLLSNSCLSTDFYFTPPAGTWTATLDVTDKVTGNSLEQEVLPFKSRTTNALRLLGVSVCDSTLLGIPLCGLAPSLLGKTALLEKIAPSATVSLSLTGNVVRRDISLYCPDPVNNCNDGLWWEKTAADINRLYTNLYAALDLLASQRTTFFGMARPNVPGGIGGIADAIPGHAAFSRTSALRFASNTETVVEVVAHETGHTLGMKHTNTNVPAVSAAPPGCYNFAQDGSTDWPFPNNRIQSLQGLEVPFDVAAKATLDPNTTYDVLSYCSPRWISPQRYKTGILTLGGGAVTSVSAPEVSAPVATQAFWTVSGSVPTVGPPQFDPLFQSVLQGDLGGGSGNYSLEVQNAAAAVLFARHFNLATPQTESNGPEYHGTPRFTELLPVTAGAARIVLKDPTNTVLGIHHTRRHGPDRNHPQPDGIVHGLRLDSVECHRPRFALVHVTSPILGG